MFQTTFLALVLVAAFGSEAAMAETCVPATKAGPMSGIPEISATIGGQALWTTSTNGAQMECSSLSGSIAGGQFLAGSVAVDPDPLLAYGVTFNNNAGSSDRVFTLVLTAAYADGPYNAAFSTMSGAVTDGGDGVVNVGPGPASDVQQPFLNGVPFGAIVGGCGGVVGRFSSTSCGQGNLLDIAMLSSPSGTLEIDITADVSAGDIFTVNGAAGLFNETPEPASIFLMGSGLALIGLAGRRLRRL